MRYLVLFFLLVGVLPDASGKDTWKKHVVHTGFHTNTAIGADFTGDGRVDIIANSGGKTRLFVAPDWREVVLDDKPKHNFIHSEVIDVDGDGDPDWIGARYMPGLIVWLECPAKPESQPWNLRVVDDKVMGIHGLLRGDIDGDGRTDLIANSALPKGGHPESLVWYDIPPRPKSAKGWSRHVFADKDAPGLSHYLGYGDVNGDGRADAASAAKGDPAPPGTGDWFAWWEAPEDPKKKGWKKHLIAKNQKGATNIHPADVNGDSKVDFIASRGHGKGIIWFEATKSGWKERPINLYLTGPHCLVVTDMDGDGDVDAATCAKDDKIAAWFENDGKGKFETHVVGRDQAAYDIRALDMDSDGDLDLLIAGQTSKNVVWYENPRQRLADGRRRKR